MGKWRRVNGSAPMECRMVTCEYCHGTRIGSDGKECRPCMGIGQRMIFSHAETRKRHEIPEGDEVEGE